MSTTIPLSFVKQFERDVHLAYQRMSAKLTNRGLVRRKDNIVGASTTFQKIGSGTASSKARHAKVDYMNLVHEPILCTLVDKYAGEPVDKLDELKIYHDERLAVAQSIAGALGRASDAFVVEKMDADVGDTSTVGTVDKAAVEVVYELFGNRDVPNDGLRNAVVDPAGWTDLMAIEEFASLDYIPSSETVYSGFGNTMKRWFSFNFCEFSGLTTVTTTKYLHFWHRSAIGFASGKDVSMDITWQGKEQMHLFVGCLSQGACVIDDRGHYLLKRTI